MMNFTWGSLLQFSLKKKKKTTPPGPEIRSHTSLSLTVHITWPSLAFQESSDTTHAKNSWELGRHRSYYGFCGQRSAAPCRSFSEARDGFPVGNGSLQLVLAVGNIVRNRISVSILLQNWQMSLTLQYDPSLWPTSKIQAVEIHFPHFFFHFGPGDLRMHLWFDRILR